MIQLLLDTPALIGWSLIALTLQGVLVMLAYRAGRRRLATAAPERRYGLAVGTLALLFISLPLTLVLALAALAPRLAGEITSAPDSPVLALADAPVAKMLPWLAIFWGAGFLLVAARVVVGGFRLWWLCRSSAQAGAELTPTRALLLVAGLSEAPVVLESNRVSTPFVTGWGRGVMMLPAGVMARLPAAERQAVILHELVHLRRGDFAVNLIQRIVSALLWFEPAVWLIGAELERLREECCDAAVVRAVGGPVQLARALVRLEELRVGRESLALASTDGALSERVRRLLSGGASPSPLCPSAWPALALVGAMSLGGASLGGRWAAVLASHGVPVVTIRAEDPAGLFTLEMAGGVLRGMSLGGALVPRSRLSQTGRVVHLLDERGHSELDITISSPGAIHWSPRPAHSP